MSVVRECTKPGLIMARAKGVSADRLAVALKVERDTLEVGSRRSINRLSDLSCLSLFKGAFGSRPARGSGLH